jgi:uncharacterized protein (DUF302 family)
VSKIGQRDNGEEGVDFSRECLIFEVCQPQQAKKVLEENMSISTMRPCRISLYDEGVVFSSYQFYPSSTV